LISNVTPRTSKSGLLPSSSTSDMDSATNATTSNEQRSASNKNYCYSLPSRKMKRKKKSSSLAKSVTNLPQAVVQEEQVLIQEVRQKLNALLLYKYQHSKASRELAEVREALARVQQSRDSEGLSSSGMDEVDFYEQRISQLKQTDTVFPMRVNNKHLSAIGGRNRNSTSSGKHKRTLLSSDFNPNSLLGTSSVENKYETIEKSLSPYKIDPSENSSNNRSNSPGKAVQVSIRKQLLRLHEQQSQSEAKAKLQKVQQQLQQFSSANIGGGESSFHPYLPRETLSKQRQQQQQQQLSSISPSFSSSSSSHYAQISPLRGVGRPLTTPTSYFQVKRQTGS
jgi:hypothetical protein